MVLLGFHQSINRRFHQEAREKMNINSLELVSLAIAYTMERCKDIFRDVKESRSIRILDVDVDVVRTQGQWRFLSRVRNYVNLVRWLRDVERNA